MYGKLFAAMYDGTLAADWQALVTFQQMIVLCDADGILDVTPEALHRRTGIPLDVIKAGITALEAPDPQSRTPDCNGARITRIDDHRDWGWHLVNHEKYKILTDSDTKRAQTRERVRRHREKQRNADVTPVTHGNASKRHTDTDTDKKKIYVAPKNGAQGDVEKIFEHWQTTFGHTRAKLDDKRRKLIRDWLKPGLYTAEDLIAAIDGCSRTPHNMGKNDRGTEYHALGLILKDADNIDRFMGNASSNAQTEQRGPL